MSWAAQKLVDQLIKVVGPSRVKVNPSDLEFYGQDWSKAATPNPSAVVFPNSIDEVQGIVAIANEFNFPLVPSGGRTGLSGGALAYRGEVVVSFDRMNKILKFDATDNLVTCQPGVITGDLKKFAESEGLFYPVDFASTDASQLGGNVATNAGGINVLRYGMTRNWVEGMKVVTGAGELLDLNRGLKKNATGFDFRHLFIGSEGTLGFIVELTLALTSQPKDPTVMFLGLQKIENIIKTLPIFKEKLNLTAFEFFCGTAMQKVMEAKDFRNPFGKIYPFYLLVEFENDPESQLDVAYALFDKCLRSKYVIEGVLSQNQRQADSLWKFREGITESIASYNPFKSDVSCRISKIPAFLRKLEELLRTSSPYLKAIIFGHLGDGNIHINLIQPIEMDSQKFQVECNKLSELIFELVQSFEGSMSAEHGIGLAKKPYLHYSRSEVELRYMRDVKCLFDPKNIMNPGKLLDI